MHTPSFMRLLELGRGAWADARRAAESEWWLGNGLGGWASGTVGWARSRIYHALLAAALTPPAGRTVLLAKVDETLTAGGEVTRLYTNFWADGTVEEEGVGHLVRFCLDPHPCWLYAAGGWLVERRVLTLRGQNATLLLYRLRPGPGADAPAVLRLRPLVTCRGIHAVSRAGPRPPDQTPGPAGTVVEAWPGAPRLALRAERGRYVPGGWWVYGLLCPYEALRGVPGTEDLYVPGEFEFRTEDEATVALLATAAPGRDTSGAAGSDGGDGDGGGDRDPAPAALPDGWAEEALAREARRQGDLLAGAGDGVRRMLIHAGDQLVCHRASTGTATLLAGFPWFTDWGRDTMISLPGLALCGNRPLLAREWLRTFARHARDGLVPNHFPEDPATGAGAAYNSADATLWYAVAAWRYLERTGDRAFVLGEVYPFLKDVVARHLRGTRHGIRVAEDGLLRCGHPDVQVTWMDARVGDRVVTPRDGFPVEIQALWHATLQITARLAEAAGESPSPYLELAARAAASFRRRFWAPELGYLPDRLDRSGNPDPTLRPNQLLAVALDFPLLEGPPARQVVMAVWRRLWTPFGLRSLDPRHPDYRGRYVGSPAERDAMYHQGPVWAWLAGPFVSALLRAWGRSPEALALARETVEGLVSHLPEYGLGTVAEIFDGEPPHAPRGCPSQAWSIAELLRVWTEEVPSG